MRAVTEPVTGRQRRVEPLAARVDGGDDLVGEFGDRGDARVDHSDDDALTGDPLRPRSARTDLIDDLGESDHGPFHDAG